MNRTQLIYKANVDEGLPLPYLSVPVAIKNILLQCITTLLWIPLSLVCVPLYLPGLIIWGRPPTIPPWSRFYRYFTATWTEGKPEDNIPVTNRILIFIIILDTVIKSPVNGVCWFLDELLYHSYHNIDIKDPVFIISACHSGSTQLANYLEDDKENFICPMVIEGMFPYIWVWKLIAPSLRIIGLQKYFEPVPDKLIGEEFKKCHNFSFFKTDTWEIFIGAGHMIALSAHLGVSFFKWGFVECTLGDHPVDQDFCKDFLVLNDHILKKVVYHRGSSNQRVLIKGHFLFAAKPLEQRYHGAKFITIVRDPVERFCSAMNYLVLGSADGPSRRMLGLSPVV